MHAIILGRRRFTCLSPSLIRIEFSPTGQFEDRRSLLAYADQKAIPFMSQTQDSKWDIIRTSAIEIRTISNDVPCNRLNLELRWSDGRLMQFWRPDDRDFQNLGGTLRSLDRYMGDAAELDGVHPATMESFDVSGTHWPTWMYCEVDPLLKDLHPNPPAHFNKRDWLIGAQRDCNDDRGTLERSFNWYKDARKFSPGLLSHSGYCFLNDSQGAVLDADDFPIERTVPGYQDWYFFAYANDFPLALRDFRLLSGPAPLPRHKSLGIIFSRWPAFSESEVTEMGETFAANGYPMSTLVMDMEWHKEGWGHWEFNPELIPDPQRFIALCHKYNLEVTFNDHPLDVREDDCHFSAYVEQAGPEVEIRTREYNGKHLRMAKVDICNKQQNQAFRSTCHTEFMKLGIDYWWNDGSRGQLSGTCGQLVTNKSFFEESERDGRRGMLLARYGGLGSHRYGVFFTGDANSDYPVLRLECEFTIRAGSVGISSISHDIGGFGVSAALLQTNAAGVAIMPPKQYLRWLQFGVFNPILRFHSAPGCGSRKPYDYDGLLNNQCAHWLRIRHSLLPYIYTAMREHYDTGIPLIRGLYLSEPDNPESYRWDQYFFGPDLLVAPILSEVNARELYLPAGSWWEFETDKLVAGSSRITRTVTIDQVPVYVRSGSIIPRQSPDADLHAAHINDLILEVYTGKDCSAELYEDDGVTSGYQNGQYVRTSFSLCQNNTLTPSNFTLQIHCSLKEGQPFATERSVTIRIHHHQVITAAHLLHHGSVAVHRESANCYVVVLPVMKTNQDWTLTLT